MVIMWSNNDGSVTLSQRMSSGETMPTVQASPPRVASVVQSATNLASDKPQLAFSIPKNSDTAQAIIWAYSTTNPGSANVDARIVEHIDKGGATLDLTQPLSSASPTPTPSVQSGSSGSLTYHQRIVVAHGVLCVIGFLLLLPLGALVSRYLRTINHAWFKAHWFIQVMLAGPIIVVGFALGVTAVGQVGAPHANDTHKRLGIALFVLYFAQCSFGYVVHKFKPASHVVSRPYQNYAHAVIGLLIIALSMYQVRTGYHDEWLKTGKDPLPKGVDVVWILWITLLPVLYFAGLALLPRQFRQEREARGMANKDS